MKKPWLIIVVVLLLLLGMAGAIFFFRKRAAKPGASSSTGTTSSAFPLRMGSRGEEVERLQQYINKQLDSNLLISVLPKPQKLVVDGIWGELTQAAVRYVFTTTEISQETYQTL